jgi:uncharacterized protein (TIGR02391 family)
MFELSTTIHDPAVLLALEPEELGAKILFLLRKRRQNEQPFFFSNLLNELWPYNLLPGQQPPYPPAQKNEINLALSEAWSWLVAQGLLVSAPGQMSGSDGMVLSRRAKRFENEAEFAQYAVARMLPKDSLNPRTSEEVWLEFMRGKFDTAVFLAMKAVEVAVREASGMSDLDGVDLMRKAFNPTNGPLADATAKTGEKQARSDLFAGAIGSYRNPQAHRYVNLDNPTEAIEIIMLANHLLRIVDKRAGKCKLPN